MKKNTIYRRIHPMLKVLSLVLVAILTVGGFAFQESVTAHAFGYSKWDKKANIVIKVTLQHDTDSPRDHSFDFRLKGKKNGKTEYDAEYSVDVSRGNSYWYGDLTITDVDPTLTYSLEAKSTNNRYYSPSISKGKGSSTNDERILTFRVTFTPKYSGRDEGSLNNSGSSGSSGNSGVTNNTPWVNSWFNVNQGVNTRGEVSVNTVMDQIKGSNTGLNPVVYVKNAEYISGTTLYSINNECKKTGKTVVIHADTTTADGKEVQGRLYVEPAKLASVNGNVKLGVYTSSDTVTSVKNSFGNWYSNNVEVVSMGHKGLFGGRLQVAAKVNLSNLNSNTLKFYVYNRANGDLSQIIDPQYFVDSNGFVHFYTQNSGEIIITDRELTRK